MKVDTDRLVTFTVFAALYPRKKKERGVKLPYIHKLLDPTKTSQKKLIRPVIIDISGVRFIYLNDYALSLLNLSYTEAREMIKKILSEEKTEAAAPAGRKPGPSKKKNDDELYIET